MLANLENKSQVIQRGENTAAWLDKPKIRPKSTQGWKLRTEFHFLWVLPVSKFHWTPFTWSKNGLVVGGSELK